MSTVLSALVVVAALIASGVILVQLFMSESRRASGQAAPRKLRVQPVEPERRAIPLHVAPQVTPQAAPQAASVGHTPLPERAVPPPPAPRVRRVPVRPAPARPAPVAPVQTSWVGTLSPDGAWLWTGSAWVPAWWGGPTVPPPPPFVAPPPPARSHGCLAAFGMGCAVMLGVVALIVLVVIAAAGGLSGLLGG